ncbi:MAG: hypothetical protein BWZ00_00691 [Bacteroidetes bacterium ADurb.BinA174]|nr:MAG: hypothetical protein BWZ00_00691 [Bacteroidetes bacterium ADurb.BinA174]
MANPNYTHSSHEISEPVSRAFVLEGFIILIILEDFLNLLINV